MYYKYVSATCKVVIGIAVYTAYTVDSHMWHASSMHLVTEYTEATVINELSTTRPDPLFHIRPGSNVKY